MNGSAFRLPRLVAALAVLLWCLDAAAAAPDAALQAAVANPARSPNFVARDKARHPAAELAFFGIKPNMTVVELWPGGGYWTEILGPYLAKQGTYYAALDPNGAVSIILHFADGSLLTVPFQVRTSAAAPPRD